MAQTELWLPGYAETANLALTGNHSGGNLPTRKGKFRFVFDATFPFLVVGTVRVLGSMSMAASRFRIGVFAGLYDHEFLSTFPNKFVPNTFTRKLFPFPGRIDPIRKSDGQSQKAQLNRYLNLGSRGYDLGLLVSHADDALLYFLKNAHAKGHGVHVYSIQSKLHELWDYNAQMNPRWESLGLSPLNWNEFVTIYNKHRTVMASLQASDAHDHFLFFHKDSDNRWAIHNE